MAVSVHPGAQTQPQGHGRKEQGPSGLQVAGRILTGTIIAVTGAYSLYEMGSQLIGSPNVPIPPLISQCPGDNGVEYLVRGTQGTDSGMIVAFQAGEPNGQTVRMPLNCEMDMNTINLRGYAGLGYQGVVVENANGSSSVVAETPKAGENVDLRLIPEGSTIVNGQVIEIFATTLNGHVVHVAIDLGAPNSKVTFEGAYGKTAAEFAAMLNAHAGTPIDIVLNTGAKGSQVDRMVEYLASPTADPSTQDVPAGVGLYFGLGNTQIEQSVTPTAINLPPSRR